MSVRAGAGQAELRDVIVCDYNYVFDPQVYFRRFFLEADYSNAILVVDEAHNLVQRAMDYYSPSLSRQHIRDLRGNLRHVEPSQRRNAEVVGGDRRFFPQPGAHQGRRIHPTRRERRGPGQVPDSFAARILRGPQAVFNKLTVRYLLDKTTSGRAIPDDPVDEFFSAFGQFCVVLGMEGEEFSVRL